MRRRGERGETLAEVLVSTTLLGIIGLGIIGAIASVLISTDIDRRVSAGETVLRSYVAAIEAAQYEPCAGADSYAPDAVGYVDPQKPANFTARVSEVRYPDLTPTRPVLPPSTVQMTFPNASGSCTADPGIQRISVEVQSTGSRQTTERVEFVKRQVGP